MYWKIGVMSILTLGYAYEAALFLLARRQRKQPLPQRVSGIYDAEAYGTWSRYAGEKSMLALVSGAVAFAVYFALFAANAFAWFEQLLPESIYLGALGLLTANVLLSALLQVPFDYMDDMKIEEKYGFNKTTLHTFIADQVKGLLISLLLSGGLLCLFILLYSTMGNLFFLAIYLILMVLLFVFSTFSLPLMKIFNRFKQLPDGDLRDRLNRLFESNGFKIKRILIMDASRRTAKVNAFCAGMGRFKEIALFDNLLASYSEDEIVAVFAHELAHSKHRDSLKSTGFASLILIPVILAAQYLLADLSFFTAFGFKGVDFAFAFIALSSVLLTPFMALIGIPMNALSRRNEYRADAFARAQGFGAPLASALKKLSRDNFSNLNPHPLIVTLQYSHPPLRCRLEALEGPGMGPPTDLEQ